MSPERQGMDGDAMTSNDEIQPEDGGRPRIRRRRCR
jgi:hypothetical protein